jgi:hypothetical protein
MFHIFQSVVSEVRRIRWVIGRRPEKYIAVIASSSQKLAYVVLVEVCEYIDIDRTYLADTTGLRSRLGCAS